MDRLIKKKIKSYINRNLQKFASLNMLPSDDIARKFGIEIYDESNGDYYEWCEFQEILDIYRLRIKKMKFIEKIKNEKWHKITWDGHITREFIDDRGQKGTVRVRNREMICDRLRKNPHNFQISYFYDFINKLDYLEWIEEKSSNGLTYLIVNNHMYLAYKENKIRNFLLKE